MTTRTKAILINAAIMLACAIQLVRGYRLFIVAIAGLSFLLAGNVIVYLSGAKQRAIRRQQQREYWSR
jgi:hypothetical protein